VAQAAQHAKKMWPNSDAWFVRYTCGQTDRETNTFIIILCCPAGSKENMKD